MATATEPAQARDLKPGSDRNFGFVFAAVFALIGCWPLVHGQAPRWLILGLAAALAVAAAAVPSILRPLNLVWFRFGLLLHRVVSPLVMGLVFLLCVTPIAWLMRLLGKDQLGLHRNSAAKSYWIMREPPGPSPTSLKNQF
jgi:hypothetical protein